MAYPFLYGAAASLLSALDHLERFVDPPDALKKDVEEWRETLTFLPSIVESHGFSKEHLNSIYQLVYGFHYRFLSHYYSDWKILGNRFKIFQDGLHPIRKNIGKDKSLLSISLSLSLSALLSNALSPDVKVKHKLEGLPPHLVPCVAYCALYPEGYIFVRETLVNHWISQGLIEVEVDQTYHRWRLSAQYLEENGEIYFDELQQRWGVFVEPTFVFGGDIYSCRMDPVVHQAARRMASTEVAILLPPDDSHGSASTATASHIANHHKETSWNIPPPSQTQSHNILYTYMCFTPQFQLSDLEVGLHRLRVLDLSGALFQSLPPSYSFHPRELCYLGLSRNTLLESLDLSRFPNLITAAFDGCLSLENLNSTIEMPKLRHLYYTSKSSNLRIMDAPNLNTLQVSHCPNLISLSLDYSRLRRLRIFACPTLHSIDLNSFEWHIHQELILHSCVHLISIKPARAYSSSSIRAQLMEIIDIPELTQLKEWLPYFSWWDTRYLMIADCTSLRSIHDILPHLNSLQKLRIYRCRNLWIAPSEFGFLTKLKSVEISKCPKITAAWKTNEAARDVATFISHIPDVILDGQQFPFIQEDVGSQKLTSSAPGSSSASYRAPVSKVPRDMDIPFFILSSETFKTTKPSQGTSDLEYKLGPCNLVTGVLETNFTLFLLLFHSDEIEFERDKLFQLLLGPRLFSFSNFDRLLEKEFIIYSTTDILTGIIKYRINVKKVNHFSNMLKSEDLATYAVIEGENGAELDISKAKHVSVVSKDIDQTSLFENLEETTELRTFLLIRDYGSSLNQIPSTFFTAHQAMETLDLSGSHISELPSSVGEMLLLRFLDLSYTLIQRLPESIHHLTKLQTLRLKECKRLHSLPNAMKKLTSLCYLDFDVLGQLTCMPQGMGALTELRTLSAFIVSREDGCSLRELKYLNNLSGSLCISGLEYATRKDAQEAMMENKRYIDRLHLKWNESTTYDAQATEEAEFVLYGLEMKTPLKELQISFYPGSVLPKSILVNNLEQLVSITFYRWDIESLFALDRLSNLKEITFIDMDRVKLISSNLYRRYQKIRYPKLETFTIDGMLELENWTGIEECDCPFLSKLSVNYCPKLTQLDFLPHLQSPEYLEISHCESLACLPNGPLPASLQTLVIYKCNNLKTRCSNGGEDWDKIKHVPNIWIDMKGIGKDNNEESDSDEYSDDCSD